MSHLMRSAFAAVIFAFGLPGVAAGLDPANVLQELDLKESERPAREMTGWTKPKKVLVVGAGPDLLRQYQAVAPGVNVVGATSPADVVKEVVDADVLIGACEAAVVNAARKLKWVQVAMAGVNECQDIPKLMEGNIWISNGQRIYGPSIAEHTIAMLFYLTRNFEAYTRMEHERKWDRMRVPPNRFTELQGKTMLVVGLGGIGTSIAQRAHALGMRVIATRNSSREKPDFVEQVGLAHELMDLVPQADVVANAAPLTPETERMFDAAFFARMKPNSYFLNIGRGTQVVQADLIAALQSGRLAGAGLDVVEPEPLPSDDPLWSAPNLLITPHISAFSDLVNERRHIVMRENLRRYVAGEKILSLVDLKRGY